MAVLLAKSKENLLSAQMLIDNSYFSSSVHCAYYSSVQIMLHLMLTELNYSHETLEQAAKKELKGSHVFAINSLFVQMKKKSEHIKAVDFNREIGKLKNKREHADYKDTIIDKPYSDEAVTQAKAINLILSKVFSLS